MTGKMIVFDGNNGAGKTTQLALTRELLENEGYEVVATREPGGTPASEEIRSLLLTKRDHADSLTMTAETLLFFAARAQHVEKLIVPALKEGKIVLCDRFTSSTISFQCFAQNFPLERMRQIEATSLAGFKPDLTMVFDIDTTEGLLRSGAIGAEDRIEGWQTSVSFSEGDKLQLSLKLSTEVGDIVVERAAVVVRNTRVSDEGKVFGCEFGDNNKDTVVDGLNRIESVVSRFRQVSQRMQ